MIPLGRFAYSVVDAVEASAADVDIIIIITCCSDHTISHTHNNLGGSVGGGGGCEGAPQPKPNPKL